MSRKLSIRDIVYEWRESAKLGRMSSDALELLDELETALAASGAEPTRVPSGSEIINKLGRFIKHPTGVDLGEYDSQFVDEVQALFRASGSEPMEMRSDAVTPLTDGIDGTPYMYAVLIDRYEAANTLAAVLAYPDSGDWHAQMRSKLAMVARSYKPNKIWGTEQSDAYALKRERFEHEACEHESAYQRQRAERAERIVEAVRAVYGECVTHQGGKRIALIPAYMLEAALILR